MHNGTLTFKSSGCCADPIKCFVFVFFGPHFLIDYGNLEFFCVTTLPLGSQPRQRLARLRAKREVQE
jgi:hypothetical protein